MITVLEEKPDYTNEINSIKDWMPKLQEQIDYITIYD
jgi:hypothetical protein